MHLQKLKLSLNSVLDNKLKPMIQNLDKNTKTNLRDSYFIKYWTHLPGYQSLSIFYHYQTRRFWGVLQTQEELEFIPSVRNGFELIKVSLLQDPVIRDKIVNSQHPFSSPQEVVAFFKTQLKYPTIKQGLDGYTIQLHNTGLLGGGAQASKIGFTVEPENYKDTDINKKEYKEIVKFLIDHYKIIDYEFENSSDRQLVSELAKAIWWLMPSDQRINIKKHLNIYIGAYEEMCFDDQVLTYRVKELLSEKLLPRSNKHYCSLNLYIELLKKGYFSKERTRRGVEWKMIDRILIKMTDEIKKFIEDTNREGKNQNEEIRMILLMLNRKERISNVLQSLSEPQCKNLFNFLTERLHLETEDQQEITHRLCSVSTRISNSSDFPGDEFKNEKRALEEIDYILNREFPYSDLAEPENLIFYLSRIRLNVLTGLNLLDHNLSTLVELYNMLKSDTSKDSSNESILTEIKNTLKSVIKAYREQEANLESGELKSLLSIAFVQDVELFRAFLEAFLADLSSDVLFDPIKVRIMAIILISAMRNYDFKKYCQVDDLIKCFKILIPRIQDLSITSENVNIQEAMSSMNDILFLMGFIGANGIKNEYFQTVINFTKYMQIHLLENAFNAFKGTVKDPSLDIKREYTLEALKRIEMTDFEKWEQHAAKISQAGQVFMGDMSSINGALLQIKDLLIKSVADLPSTWYDDANKLRFLENAPIKNAIDEIFQPNRNHNRNYSFFAAEFLIKLAGQPDRKLFEKKTAVQALWFLTNGYDYKQSMKQRSRVESKTHSFDSNIHFYVKQSLTSLIQNVDINFGLYIRKTLEGPLKIESLIGFMQTNVAATLKQYEKSARQEDQDDPGKQFYLKVLSQKRPKLYAISRIQNRSEKTLEKPSILIDFKGIDKDKDFDDAFLKKIEERANKLSSTDVEERLRNLKDHKDLKTTMTKDIFYDMIKNICSQEGKFNPEKQSFAKQEVIRTAQEAIKKILRSSASDLFETLENFLNNPSKQVLLIQGDAGTGKTLLMRLYEDRLRKRYNVLSKADYKNRNRLPIRIVLSEVKSFNMAIEEFLLQHGCDDNGIEEIKKEPAVILFDGYDEINQYINLYNMNNLDTWADLKVVFTSRKENLASLKEDYLSCFTPGKDKDKVLSYALQAIGEEQIINYFTAQRKDKMQLITGLKQQLYSLNSIDSHFMPISNIIKRKIKFVNRLATTEIDKCLSEILAMFKRQLPVLREYGAEIENLGMTSKTQPLESILNKHIDQLTRVTSKEKQRLILKNLGGDLLEIVKNAEKTLNILKNDTSEKDNKYSNKVLAEVFNTEKESRPNNKQKSGPDTIRAIKLQVKSLKRSTCLKTVQKTLQEILRSLNEGCLTIQRELGSPDEIVLEHTKSKLIRSEIKVDIEIIKELKNAFDNIVNLKQKYSYSYLEQYFRDVPNATDAEAFIHEIEELNVQIDNLAQCLNLEREVYSLVSAQSGQSQPSQSNQELLGKTMKKLIDQFDLVKKHANAGHGLNLISIHNFPDVRNALKGGKVEKYSFNVKSFELYNTSFETISATLEKINSSKNVPIDHLTKLHEVYIRKVTNIYYVNQMYSPIQILLEQIEKARIAKEDLKVIKSFTKKGFDIVHDLQRQSDLIRASEGKKAEPLVQKLNQMVQEIKIRENEFKSIKDEFTEESLMIKSLRRQIQALMKFTDPEHLVETLKKFKDIIKSPFILRMLTETLVKFPDTSANKAELYRLYVDMHFEREREKMLQTEQIPPKFNIQDSFYQFSKDLATNMFLKNIVSLRAQSYGYRVGGHLGNNENIWSGFFDNSNEIIRLARRGAPIVEEEGNVRFVHKSILEYFTARQFYDEIVEYNPDNLEEFEPFLNKKSILDNETVIYQAMENIIISDKEKNKTVFEKQVKEMLTNSNLLGKFGDFNQHFLFPNTFLLSLLCPEILSNLASTKDVTFVLIINKLFEWIFTPLETSFNFVQALERLLEADKGLYKKIRPLVMLYYDHMSKQQSEPDINDRSDTAQRNIQIKVNLTSTQILSVNDLTRSGISNKKEFSCTIKGKFFVHDSLYSIVVLETGVKDQYVALDLDPKTIIEKARDSHNRDDSNKQDGSKPFNAFNAVLIDSRKPWEMTECKWILKLNDKSHEIFELRSLADTSKTLSVKVKNPEECTELFEGICFNDLIRSPSSSKVFICLTCNRGNPKTICRSCLIKCHKGHEITESNENSTECGCKSSGCCRLVSLCEARFQDVRRVNDMHRCGQCPNDEKNKIVCSGCIKHHHSKDHNNFVKVPGAKGCGCLCKSRRSQLLSVWQEEREIVE